MHQMKPPMKTRGLNGVKAKRTRFSGQILPRLGHLPQQSDTQSFCQTYLTYQSVMECGGIFSKKRLLMIKIQVLIDSGLHINLFILNLFKNKRK